jgi:hypothetical protein
MNRDELCRLALAAIDDADARPVLSDALEETGWWDERVEGAVEPKFNRRVWTTATLSWVMVERGDRPNLYLASAVAAVLLFGDWPTSWPLASACCIVSGLFIDGSWFPCSYTVWEQSNPFLPDVEVHVEAHRDEPLLRGLSDRGLRREPIAFRIVEQGEAGDCVGRLVAYDGTGANGLVTFTLSGRPRAPLARA